MVFAGAIAKQVLSLYNVYVGAHIYRINDVADEKFNPISVSKNDIELITKKDFPVIDDSKTEQMKAKKFKLCWRNSRMCCYWYACW